MSTKANQQMFNSTARRLPLEQKADTPTNTQSKQLTPCEDFPSAEFEGGKALEMIEGGASNRTPKGKSCRDD